MRALAEAPRLLLHYAEVEPKLVIDGVANPTGVKKT